MRVRPRIFDFVSLGSFMRLWSVATCMSGALLCACGSTSNGAAPSPETPASAGNAPSPTALAARSIPGLSGRVTVQYDAQDIPHIQCTQAADCIAVQGYLQARDRWFPMDYLRHVAEGRLAELIGPDGLASDVQLRTLFTTRGGNRVQDELRQAVARDPKTLELLTAFARGVNAYLDELRASHGALPGEYAQLPVPLTPADIDPWRIEDTLAMGRLNQFQLSETLTAEIENGKFAAVYGPSGSHPDAGKMLAWVRAPAPPTERAHTVSAAASRPPGPPGHGAVQPPGARRRQLGSSGDVSPWRDALTAAASDMAALRERLRPADASIGSNNWVVARAKSASGAAMVANDPHLPLQYPPLFHLAAMTSSNPADHLDLTGGSFPGIAGALVGRGAHVGWGVTVVGYDVTDVYLEQFSPCPGAGPTDPPCVAFHRAQVPTRKYAQTYQVRTGPGPAGLVDAATLHLPVPDAVLVVPHHGPVIQAPDPATGKGLSVRWTGHEGTTQDSKAFLGLNTATDVDGAMRALKDYATGAQNFVLADDQGNIAYDPHALVPIRRFAVKGSPYRPWFPLPGDGTAEWGNGGECAGPTAVPAACWIPDDELPRGKNPAKGYYFTANADPLGVSDGDDNDPRPGPGAAQRHYLSFAWDDSSGFRATRIEQMIEAALARGGGKLSLDDMMRIQSDHVSRVGMAFAPFIAAIPARDTPPEFGPAQKLLATWIERGADCPSGLTGADPKRSPADTAPAVVQGSSGCFLFHAFLRTLVTRVFTDDLALAGQQVNGLAAVKAMLFMLQPENVDRPEATAFCASIDKTGQEILPHQTCKMQIVTALVEAYRALSAQVGSDPSTWIWGRAHTIKPVSLFARVAQGYSPGPYARPGGTFTVDVGNASLTAAGLDFPYRSSGNVRHISVMDPARPVVKMQLPGPERDGPVGTPGPDLLGQWVRNSYFDYAAGGSSHAAAVATQTFQAP
jgi:penicillin amidase